MDRPRRIPRYLTIAGLCLLNAAPVEAPERVEEFASDLNKRALVFNASGDTAYFALRSGDGYVSALCIVARSAGHWGSPRVLPFSGAYYDTDPSLSPDGTQLYFVSNRPTSGEGPAKRDLDIWVADRFGDGWRAARRLPEPINSPSNDASPQMLPDSSLLFASAREGGRGSYDLYVASRKSDTGYVVSNLGATINTDAAEFWPALSPDGKLLLFVAIGRPDELIGPGARYQRGDLYASIRSGRGWSAPIHLPEPINSPAAECCVRFSPDGSEIFFTSERGALTYGAPRRMTARDIDSVLGSKESGAGNPYRISVAAIRAAVSRP